MGHSSVDLGHEVGSLLFLRSEQIIAPEPRVRRYSVYEPSTFMYTLLTDVIVRTSRTRSPMC